MSEKKTIQNMNNHEYKILNGTRCPYCFSTEIERDFKEEPEFDGNTVRFKFDCDTCDESFYELYTMQGWSE